MVNRTCSGEETFFNAAGSRTRRPGLSSQRSGASEQTLERAIVNWKARLSGWSGSTTTKVSSACERANLWARRCEPGAGPGKLRVRRRLRPACENKREVASQLDGALADIGAAVRACGGLGRDEAARGLPRGGCGQTARAMARRVVIAVTLPAFGSGTYQRVRRLTAGGANFGQR